LCKKRKEINCTIKTTFAAGVCGLSVAAILTGQIGPGVIVGVVCAGLIVQSVNCWNSI
jgi:uncharacterized membrane protein YczE